MSFPVLICDDSAIARKMAKRSLPDDFASEVHLACNGHEALAKLQERHFALMLLDLTMPQLDGIGVLEEIKRHSIEVFVIVVSGDIQPEMKKRVAQLGALDFIEKPVDADKLLKILNRFGLH
ncbi:response regulator [Aliiglaciecola sp. LCG003]|uniref:response regulator n=1 Tax=Aliiglaciecola sp. LCG003 TaxID=3053655 RepID=UPI0025730F9E|nr:response regulator [Aliiglaciecola sp. LCG003]WJG08682.1 response regulator [Aliiglaciecola sp. LCG003]